MNAQLRKNVHNVKNVEFNYYSNSPTNKNVHLACPSVNIRKYYPNHAEKDRQYQRGDRSINTIQRIDNTNTNQSLSCLYSNADCLTNKRNELEAMIIQQ